MQAMQNDDKETVACRFAILNKNYDKSIRNVMTNINENHRKDRLAKFIRDSKQHVERCYDVELARVKYREVR